MSSPKNSRYAQKVETPATPYMHIRVTPHRKAGYAPEKEMGR